MHSCYNFTVSQKMDKVFDAYQNHKTLLRTTSTRILSFPLGKKLKGNLLIEIPLLLFSNLAGLQQILEKQWIKAK